MNKYFKRKKSKKNTRYSNALNYFIFTAYKNYNKDIYNYDNKNSIEINAIPVIVKFKHDEGDFRNRTRILTALQYICKDLKCARFKFKHGSITEIMDLIAPIALLLGLKDGFNKLLKKMEEVNG